MNIKVILAKTIRIIFIASLFIFIFLGEKSVSAEKNEIDISTIPNKVLFDISNAKPGDTFTKLLKVQNNGSKDFKYLFSNRFLTGSEKIYNELVLTVADKSGDLYKGKLKDYEKLDSRKLKSSTSEELTFSIYFPSELGNDFQSLSCEFQFKFYVEGTLGGVLPADGPKLPDTGSDMFNILVVGAVLVLTGSTIQFFIKRRNRLDKQV
ncbi:LPXTG cell wall anchor domain-containing protein [Bacillus sp. OK048]|uniref:LPXTG cell wall anchor domain-containing protein n=1 Tax=Bacillus sp. OK048 TaxID=1882761 RepID=UPI000880894B|nr:LPXTG cell wall anchor domain-containing protein [Bacillus sp. OK048]SDL91106.1 LPXTG-motif cell wall anchor domain-containing protein [Bacillus sp. OK048]